jgi:hypothetical protein
MFQLAFVIVVVAASGDQPTQTDSISEYRARARDVGRDADAHVRLALWCERNGLEPERVKHLAMAILSDPDHALARALMGQFRDGARWVRASAIGPAESDTPIAALRDQYRERREQTANTAEARYALALWCEQKGLKEQAKAHLTEVTRLAPNDERAWKRLGYKRIGGQWFSDEDQAQFKIQARGQNYAEKHWRPKINAAFERLKSRDAAKRDAALAELYAITDPRAVPEIVRGFLTYAPNRQSDLVAVLGQIDATSASRSLAAIATLSPDPDIRRVATETLRRRDYREFADMLIPLVRAPFKYEVRPIGGPSSPGVLYVDGEEYNIQRVYEVAAPPDQTPRGCPLSPNEILAFSAQGEPLAVRDDTRFVSASNFLNSYDVIAGARFDNPVPEMRVRSLLAPDQRVNFQTAIDATARVQRTLESDVAQIEAINQEILARNERVLPILQAVTGLTMGPDVGRWREWWLNQVGLAETRTRTEKPTLTQMVFEQPQYTVHSSCFGAGTLVQTQHGPRPIETLESGDLVLSQNTATGALGYQPVLLTHHNPPSATVVLQLENGDAITTSLLHRFWVAGRGWVMARELNPSDRLRTLGGAVSVVKVENGAEQPVYNLDVAINHSFFVGSGATLVHDHTVPSVSETPPFDVVNVVAANPSSR